MKIKEAREPTNEPIYWNEKPVTTYVNKLNNSRREFYQRHDEDDKCMAL